MAARRVSSSPAFVKYVASGLGPVSALDGPLFDSAHYTPLPNSRRSEAQTVKEFASDEDRNPITTDRRLILFRLGEGVESSLLSAVSAWLAVFFPSMIITVMDLNMRPGNGRRPSYIVKTPAGEISVRVRGKAQQLNVLDLIDAVIYSLPAGAYCGCAVTMHDMYESADDEFICGRCVFSTCTLLVRACSCACVYIGECIIHSVCQYSHRFALRVLLIVCTPQRVRWLPCCGRVMLSLHVAILSVGCW